jgi:RNA polymerase sigma factor (sigma-70 family)
MKPQFDFILTEEERSLVEDNIGLVTMVVRKRFHRCSMPFDDLVQEGCFGLMSAAHYYLHRGVSCKFSTFAVPRIVQRLKYVLGKKDLVYLTEKIKKFYYAETGKHLADEDLAMILDCEMIDLPKLIRFISIDLSQNDTDFVGSNERYKQSILGDTIVDDRLSPLDLLVLKEMALRKQDKQRQKKLQKARRLREMIDYSDW